MTFKENRSNESRDKVEKLFCSPRKVPIVTDRSQSTTLVHISFVRSARYGVLEISLQWKPRFS
jgi:hypothetical protein